MINMTSKKRILIAGGSHSDIPMIKAAKAMGFYVITSGNRADDIGHRYSDEMHLQDYSDKEKMLALAKALKIDAICASSNDFSQISSSYVAEKLGLPGFDSYDTTLLLHHKDRYRAFAQKNNLLSPKAESCSSLDEAEKILRYQQFPVIVKPIDLTGGKGIRKVYSIEEGLDAVQKAFERSRVQCAVIEEYVEGSLHSCSTFIRKGKVVFHFQDNEFSYQNPYLVSTSSSPAEVPEDVIIKLCKTVEKTAELLSLKDGLLHLQFLYSCGEPYIIEFTRRMPGDLYAIPVKNATGFNYADNVVKAAAGMDLDDDSHALQKGFHGRHCIMSPEEGILESIVIDDAIKENIIYKVIWAKRGDLIEDASVYKAGVVILAFETEIEMKNKIEKINDLIRMELK